MKIISANKEIVKSIIPVNVKERMLEKNYDTLLNHHKTLCELVDHSSLAYINLNKSQKIVEWNLNAEKIFGVAKKKSYGNLLQDILSNGEKNELVEILKDLTPVNIIKTGVFKNKNPKGKESILECFVTPSIKKNEINGVSIVIKDITKRIQVEKELISFRKMVQNIFGFAPIGIYQADSEGGFVDANPELAWMLGYESSDKLIRSMRDVATQMFTEKKTAEDFFFTLFEAEELKRFRCQMLRKDKSSFWGLSFAKITKNESDRVDGFYGFIIDITNNVRTEEKLNKVNKELEQMAIMDGLTKISNRRKFDEYLDLEWKRILREKENDLSMILCDIDYFKLYNDSYGHQAGDECLKKVAQAIKGCAKRPADLTARYGGEEFALILPNTDLKGAVALAETIRETVKNLKISHKSSRVDKYVTLSLGVSSMNYSHRITSDNLIKLSDDALYKAKEQGRNCVISV